jgi:hypothetical protein
LTEWRDAQFTTFLGPIAALEQLVGKQVLEFETSKEITEHLPHFVEEAHNKRRLRSPLGYLKPQQFEDQHIRQTGKSAA